MTWIDILTIFFMLLAGFLFLYFVELIIKKSIENRDNLFDYYDENERKAINEIKNRETKNNTKPSLENIHTGTTPFFKKKQKFFKGSLFFFKDLQRDILRIGKKREQRVNIIYMDDNNCLHPKTGFLINENIEFFIGGIKIIKGLNEVLREKIYIHNKLYLFYFIPFYFYENMSFKQVLEPDFKITIDNLERDRTRIIENDITKTALNMDDGQASVLRTSVIVAFLGGMVIQTLVILSLLLLFM